MNGPAPPLSPIEWAALAGCLLLGSLLAGTARRGAGTARGFFLADRSLPWPLVAASSIAAEIGIAALLVLPGAMAALEGYLSPLAWTFGALAARAIIGHCFVKAFYEGEVQSPYDVMGRRLGSSAKALGSALFAIGAFFGHGARILLAVLPVALLGGLPFGPCFAAVVLCAVAWVCAGGIRAVVWIDLLHLLLLLAGCTGALLWVLGGFDDGWTTLRETLASAERFDGNPVDKLQIVDLGVAPGSGASFWLALLAVPFLQLHLLGIDQIHAQRLFCCRSPQEAKKAILWGSLGQLANPLLLLLGGAIFVFYQLAPPTDPAVLSALRWTGAGPGASAAVLPVWAATELPGALRTLLLVGFLAAAASALAALLLALSQTSLSMLREGQRAPAEARRLVRQARALVAAWGIAVASLGFGLLAWRDEGGIEAALFARTLPACVAGPLLAIFLLSLERRTKPLGLAAGVLLSFLAALVLAHVHLLPPHGALADLLAKLPLFELVPPPDAALRLRFAPEWLVPASTLLTLLCARANRSENPS